MSNSAFSGAFPLLNSGTEGFSSPNCWPTRPDLLGSLYARIVKRAGFQTKITSSLNSDINNLHCPHPALRLALLSDPAIAALLPILNVRIAPGNDSQAPFFIGRSGLIFLPPALLADKSALAAAARWAIETLAYLQARPLQSGLDAVNVLTALLKYGAGLLEQIQPKQRDLVIKHLSENLAVELTQGCLASPSPDLLAWQASRIESLNEIKLPFDTPCQDPACAELAGPTEQLLSAGGDSRLYVDPASGLNRYGTAPRPRPEAIQFSSSTATSVSDDGFMLCEALRWDLLMHELNEDSIPGRLRAGLVDAIGEEIMAHLGLSSDEGDIVLAPSGTDTELLAVMLSLSIQDDCPLTNILVAPEESGRGMLFAGGGLYFDDVAASGAPVIKGRPAWPGRDIRVIPSPIRDKEGRRLPDASIEENLTALAKSALTEKRRVLLHGLVSSKTGLSAPHVEALERIASLDSDNIDVVIDSCQMRVSLRQIGEWVRQGWMVQISGSKFFTGPPFSGALILPAAYRSRAAGVARLFKTAPGVGRTEDWNAWWRPHLDCVKYDSPVSFGALFRWLPALVEAELLRVLPPSVCQYAFERFRLALCTRLAHSTYLDELKSPPEKSAIDGFSMSAIFTSSIICFSVTTDASGGKRHLDPQECQQLFELLNLDVSDWLTGASAEEMMLATQPAHIGQPVVLAAESGRKLTILRLVVGARFFTLIGHAGQDMMEAALEAEISDALRAIDKLEILARHWDKIISAMAASRL